MYLATSTPLARGVSSTVHGGVPKKPVRLSCTPASTPVVSIATNHLGSVAVSSTLFGADKRVKSHTHSPKARVIVGIWNA